MQSNNLYKKDCDVTGMIVMLTVPINNLLFIENNR